MSGEIFTKNGRLLTRNDTVMRVKYDFPISALLVYLDQDTPDTGTKRGICENGDFIYSGGTSKIWTYEWNDSANWLVKKWSTTQFCYGVWHDGTFLYAACKGAIATYTTAVDGKMTNVGWNNVGNPGGKHFGVIGDGTFVYVAHEAGISSYSVDGAGVLTHIDTDTQGSTFFESYYQDIFIQNGIIFVASHQGGVRTYKADALGILTHIDADVQGGVGSQYSKVTGDGNFIYATNTVNGVRVYDVDVDGYLTYINVDMQAPGLHVTSLYFDHETNILLYGVTGGEIFCMKVNDDGSMVLLDSNDAGSHPYCMVRKDDVIIAGQSSYLYAWRLDVKN